MSEYNMTPKKLFEMGCITADRFWQLSTPEERDAMVIEDIEAGRTSIESPEYHDYYNRRMSGRWDPRQFSQETRERFPWLNDEGENI
jgi:hypothetical protein